MILSLLASSLIGFVFIVVMTLAIPDLTVIKSATHPLVAIAAHHLGNNAATVFMLFIPYAPPFIIWSPWPASAGRGRNWARPIRFLSAAGVGQLSSWRRRG
jgi:hypothetical protein